MIGDEAKVQILAREGWLPDAVIACVGCGSNTIGLFTTFKQHQNVSLGVEPAGLGIDTNIHDTPLKYGWLSVYFSMKSAIMQTNKGQLLIVNLSGLGDKDIFTVPPILQSKGEI